MYFYLFFLWMTFALVFVVGKLALEYFSVLGFLVLRMVIAGVIMLSCVFYKYSFSELKEILFRSKNKRKKSLFMEVPTLALLGLSSFLHIFLPFLLEYSATLYLHPTKISLLYSLTPFLTILIALAIKAESLTLNKIVGIVLGCASGILLTVNFNQLFLIIKSGSIFGFYEVLLLIAIFIDSLAWFFVEELMMREIPLFLINGISMFTAGLGFLFFKVIFYKSVPMICLSTNYIGWILLLSAIFLSNFVGYSLYSYLLSVYSPTFISLTGFLCPFFTSFFSWIFFGSTMFSLKYLLSLIFGFFGLLVFSFDLAKKE